MIMNMWKRWQFKIIEISKQDFMLQLIAKDKQFHLIQGIYF